MSISPVDLRLPKQNIKNFTPVQRFVRGMEIKSLAPVIFLECFVTGGRTLNAQKRGGFIESRERFTEEVIGALFWFGGVKVLNKVNDTILRKLMGIKDSDFDVVKDSIRDPLANYMKKVKDAGKSISKTKIAAFKFTKVAASVVMANALVGFVVPKINQGITKMYQTKQQNQENSNTQNNTQDPQNIERDFLLSPVKPKMEDFTGKKDKDPTFTGAEKFLWLANKLENDSYWQLMSTDIGVTGGRAISARNTPERIEILWRDIVSIFFYMFSMPLINGMMNKFQLGHKDRLNPVGARQTTDYMQHVMEQMGHKEGSIPVADFEDMMFGNKDITARMSKVQPEIKDGAITLDKFLETIKREFSKEDYDRFADLAKRMSQLQPQKEGVSMLAESQVKAMFEGGALNNPDFWDNVFTVAKGTETRTEVINGVRTKVELPNHKNPMRFIAQSELDGTIDTVKTYVRDIIKRAKDGTIDTSMLEKACKKNMKMNILNWGTGFAVSALFLSTIIPKIQYWITKVTTGSDSFPGVSEYDNKTSAKK